MQRLRELPQGLGRQAAARQNHGTKVTVHYSRDGSLARITCSVTVIPKHYPEAIVGYANTRGADKIIYAGYFPMGLSIERIMTEMPNVGFKDDVWPKFLRTNALRVLGLD